MVYTIGEMAQMLDVPASTLRYYDKEGLLPFVERSNGGMRVFKTADYEWLQIIGCLKKTGMSLKDIRKFIYLVMQGDASIRERLELFEKRKQEVERQLEEIKETLNTINYKCWFYETAKAAGTVEVHDNLSIEDIPDEYQDVVKKLKNM